MRFKALLLSALLATTGVLPAAAQDRARGGAFEPNWIMPAQGQRPEQRQQRERRPLREVIGELRSRYGGEYVDHYVEEGGRPLYVIRWRMPDGSYRDFRVPAER